MSRNQRLGFLAIAAVFAVVAVLILVTRDDDESTGSATTAVPTATTPAATGTTAVPQTTVTTGATTTTTAPTTTSDTGGVTAPEDAQDTGGVTAPEDAEPALPVLERGEEGRIEVSKGDRVRFVVRSDVADEVHVHGYDISKEVAAGGEVAFSFEADITGIFEIELENAGEPLGELVVNP